jgi:regulator of replication initiation timing
MFEQNLDLGDVNRVDIFDVVDRNNQRIGCKRGAFVHMNSWNTTNSITKSILEDIPMKGQYVLWLPSSEGIARKCFWILKKLNREPIQETNLNVHQMGEQVDKIYAVCETLSMKIEYIISKNNELEIENVSLKKLLNMPDEDIVVVEEVVEEKSVDDDNYSLNYFKNQIESNFEELTRLRRSFSRMVCNNH